MKQIHLFTIIVEHCEVNTSRAAYGNFYQDPQIRMIYMRGISIHMRID